MYNKSTSPLPKETVRSKPPASAVQEGLFDKADNPRRVTLMRMIDRLNLRFGRYTVPIAAAGRRRPWKPRREFLSPCYTTAWDELLRV